MMLAMQTDPPIGLKIRRARERQRLTQADLAAQVGVSQKTVDNWENGRTRPKSSIGALEQILGPLDRADVSPSPAPTPKRATAADPLAAYADDPLFANLPDDPDERIAALNRIVAHLLAEVDRLIGKRDRRDAS